VTRDYVIGVLKNGHMAINVLLMSSGVPYRRCGSYFLKMIINWMDLVIQYQVSCLLNYVFSFLKLV
jgi:hypothetical protein